ncbi:MAG: hypothetical protein ACYTDW_00180, partial [Planctomycetota bacterium]
AFQTEYLSDQSTPKIFATIQWKYLAEHIPCSTIYLAPETLVDTPWETIEDFNSSELNLSEDPIPPNVDSVEIFGLQRSYVHFIHVRFERHAIVSRNALIIEGRDTGAVNLSKAEFGYYHYSYKFWPATAAFWDLPASLPDDIYTAKIIGTEVKLGTDPNIVLDGDGDCLPDGNDYVASFHRLLGDANGDAMVGFEDLSLFVSRWMKSPEYIGLDINGDNRINFLDYAAFMKNWGKKLQ